MLMRSLTVVAVTMLACTHAMARTDRERTLRLWLAQLFDGFRAPISSEGGLIVEYEEVWSSPHTAQAVQEQLERLSAFPDHPDRVSLDQLASLADRPDQILATIGYTSGSDAWFLSESRNDSGVLPNSVVASGGLGDEIWSTTSVDGQLVQFAAIRRGVPFSTAGNVFMHEWRLRSTLAQLIHAGLSHNYSAPDEMRFRLGDDGWTVVARTDQTVSFEIEGNWTTSDGTPFITNLRYYRANDAETNQRAYKTLSFDGHTEVAGLFVSLDADTIPLLVPTRVEVRTENRPTILYTVRDTRVVPPEAVQAEAFAPEPNRELDFNYDYRDGIPDRPELAMTPTGVWTEYNPLPTGSTAASLRTSAAIDRTAPTTANVTNTRAVPVVRLLAIGVPVAIAIILVAWRIIAMRRA